MGGSKHPVYNFQHLILKKEIMKFSNTTFASFLILNISSMASFLVTYDAPWYIYVSLGCSVILGGLLGYDGKNWFTPIDTGNVTK
jgi:hypothetical protein